MVTIADFSITLPELQSMIFVSRLAEQKCNFIGGRKDIVTMWNTNNAWRFMAEPFVSSTTYTAKDESNWRKKKDLIWHLIAYTKSTSPRYKWVTHRLSQLITRIFWLHITTTHETFSPNIRTTWPCGSKSRFHKRRFCQLTWLAIATLRNRFEFRLV